MTIRKTPPHIAVVLDVRDDPELELSVAFWTEACRVQMLEHLAPAWRDWDRPSGVHFYGTGDGVPDHAAGVIAVVEDANDPMAQGWHTHAGTRVLGVVDLLRSLTPSRTLSHEVCEMWRNPFLNQWTQAANKPGRILAIETSDPVQQNGYQIRVTMFGQTREVDVGDFVTPAWFYPWEEGPKSHLGLVDGLNEIAPGGYQIAQENGDIMFLSDKTGRVSMNASRLSPTSRTHRIVRGVTIPDPGWGA